MRPAARLRKSACSGAMTNGIALEKSVLGSPPLNMCAFECEFLDVQRFNATNFDERHSRTCIFSPTLMIPKYSGI
jgi:hypothetical protein